MKVKRWFRRVFHLMKVNDGDDPSSTFCEVSSDDRVPLCNVSLIDVSNIDPSEELEFCPRRRDLEIETRRASAIDTRRDQEHCETPFSDLETNMESLTLIDNNLQEQVGHVIGARQETHEDSSTTVIVPGSLVSKQNVLVYVEVECPFSDNSDGSEVDEEEKKGDLDISQKFGRPMAKKGYQLLEDLDEIIPMNSEQREIKRNRKKNRRKKRKAKAKKAGKKAWKVCRLSWKWIKAGLVYYSQTPGAFNITQSMSRRQDEQTFSNERRRYTYKDYR